MMQPGARPGMPGMPPGAPMMPGYRPPFPGQPMPAMLPQMPPQMPPGPVPAGRLPPAAAPGQPGQITQAALAQLEPAKRKQVLGEHLFPLVSRIQPELAGKITGMLLEIEDTEVLAMLSNPALMQTKVGEAVNILRKRATQA